MRILHVDDNVICREVVRVVLARAGHSVRSAADGSSGVRMVTVTPHDFDLVITDHEMPGMSGLEVVSNLHGLDFSGKILVYSGALNATLMDAYDLAGVDGFLSKPTPASVLAQVVEGMTPETGREFPAEGE
jgi:two-component system, chemotaxis family, chemotaxis protein CheY